MRITKKDAFLLLIVIFVFIYRIVGMLWATFPPGADIGLHNSVIASITLGGNTNFFYDFYQMGGGSARLFQGTISSLLR